MKSQKLSNENRFKYFKIGIRNSNYEKHTILNINTSSNYKEILQIMKRANYRKINVGKFTRVRENNCLKRNRSRMNHFS